MRRIQTERMIMQVQPELMRMWINMKGKRCNKRIRDIKIKQKQRQKPPVVRLMCPWPAPRLTPFYRLPEELRR